MDGLNRIAGTVNDTDAMETAVKFAGFAPKNHADYEPGKGFWVLDHDGIECEIVSYD